MNYKLKKKKKQLPVVSVEWEDFESIKLWIDNPRKNDNPKDIRALALLMAQYGQRTPVSVWIKDNVIYKGNTTYKALRYLKQLSINKKKFATFTKGIKDPYIPDQILVGWMDFRDYKEASGYGMSDNKSGEWTTWDDAKLAKLTQEQFGGMDKKRAMRLTGFKDRELNELLFSETNLPDKLPLVNIKGNADVLKADYVVVEMPNKKTRLQFMQAIGVDHFRNRVIKWSNLGGYIVPALLDKMDNEDVGDVTFTPQKRKAKKKFKFKIKSKKGK